MILSQKGISNGNPTSTKNPSSSILFCENGRRSSASECSVEMDIEVCVLEVKGHESRYDRDCRICHLSMDADDLELGCACKEDLAVAHKHCAETWFKIKGNKTCEICGSTARNVTCASESESTEQGNEPNEAVTVITVAPTQSLEGRNFWHGHRFMNYLLACLVFAFVISWLFHFNVPS